ncbi:MAG: hypothetical protein IJ466_00950 [Clostridia bacterium]|nr:hypothetical protein [Clostridia bacterium]
MRKLIAFFLAAALPMLLGGCAESRQAENQAYVIAMGLDRTEEGGIEISAQIPKISGSQNSESGGGSKSSGNYLPISAAAADYVTALERLNWSVPRELNLSQIKIIIISRALASEADFGELMQELVNTEQLFAAADVVVCEGSAKEFVNALSPTLGTRLSADIESTIEHYQSLGVMPDCSLANLNYYTQSVYSDPLAGYAILSGEGAETSKAQPASALGGSPQEIMQSAESEITTRYLGAAVFANGSFRGVLNGDQAILTNLINNSLDSFRYVFDGDTLELSPMGQCRISVDTKENPARIAISLNLSISGQNKTPDVNKLREALKGDMMEAISLARDMGADPFGFAEAAARDFLTLQEWLDYDWRSRFQDAEIEIKLRFSHAGA